MPSDERSPHDHAVRKYREAVDAEGREERNKASAKETAYIVKIGEAFRVREALRIRNLKVKKPKAKNSEEGELDE